MANTMDQNLHIVAESNIDPALLASLVMADDLNIIQGLDDEPNDVGGLTAAELKATFDKAGLALQKHINEVLVPTFLSTGATEQARAEAEAARMKNERERLSGESRRELKEDAREEAERQRAAAEETRQKEEQARAEAETRRRTAEALRYSAEAQRETAEADRIAAERERESAEALRTSETEGVVTMAAKEARRAAAEAETALRASDTAVDGAERAERAAAAAEQARLEAETVAGGDFSLMLRRHNEDPNAHGRRYTVVRKRIRDQGKPDYGLGGGGDDGGDEAPVLRVRGYTGTAEVSAVVSGVEYDVDNMNVGGENVPDGTLILKKVEE